MSCLSAGFPDTGRSAPGVCIPPEAQYTVPCSCFSPFSSISFGS